MQLWSASAGTHMKDLGPEGIHADEQLPTDGSASARDRLDEVETGPTREITVSDVTLVSRHTGLLTVILSAVY
jgi:hypothetical protein